MAINWATALYSPCMDTFGRPISVNPVVSQPGQPAYLTRGIWNSGPQSYLLDDESMITEQGNTLLDVDEFDGPIPVQGDIITIPLDAASGSAALGDFQVQTAVHNGAGEWTLTLKKVVP